MFEVIQFLSIGWHEKLMKGNDVNYLVSKSDHTNKMCIGLHPGSHIIRSLK